MMGHMGVSGPGPQMNAAALMGGGMPPGAGHPGPHGMPHLNPAQAQLYQQQQMSAGICMSSRIISHHGRDKY